MIIGTNEIRYTDGSGTQQVLKGADLAAIQGAGSGKAPFANGINVGGGTGISKIVAFTPSLTPSAVSANTTAEQTFTVTGLTTAEFVIINGPAPTAGTGLVGARVSAANTLALTFANNTGGILTPAAGTYNILALST